MQFAFLGTYGPALSSSTIVLGMPLQREEMHQYLHCQQKYYGEKHGTVHFQGAFDVNA